jgi:hypothetical protein
VFANVAMRSHAHAHTLSIHQGKHVQTDSEAICSQYRYEQFDEPSVIDSMLSIMSIIVVED